MKQKLFKIGGALAFAVTIASMESASKYQIEPLFKTLSSESSFKFPFPLRKYFRRWMHMQDQEHQTFKKF